MLSCQYGVHFRLLLRSTPRYGWWDTVSRSLVPIKCLWIIEISFVVTRRVFTFTSVNPRPPKEGCCKSPKIFWCIPSSSWPSLASKYLVLPHFVLCLKVLCLLVLHWIVLSHLLFYWFGLLPLRPHIVWDFPVWSFSILSSLVFVLYHIVL